MTNEQTIAEIMNLVEHYADCDTRASHEFADDDDRKERKEARADLRATITAALAAKDAEIDALARWKSTNAPRVDALAGLLATVRANEAKGAEAISSLESERAANALLTAEIERLTAQLAEPATPEPGEWIEWKGGETAPVSDDVLVTIKCRDGDIQHGHIPSNVDWDHSSITDYWGDIVAYRVLS